MHSWPHNVDSLWICSVSSLVLQWCSTLSTILPLIAVSCTEGQCSRYFLCFSMLVYPTATLGAGPSSPKATRSAVLSLNRGFRRNTASPRCVSLVRRPFLCPVTINPTQQACHLNHFIVLDLDVAKQTSILRHYSVGNRGREISDYIFQGCFWSHQKYCKNLLRAILARTNVIPSRSTRRWGAIIGGETKSEGQVYIQGYII